MKQSTRLALSIASLLVTSACDEHDPIDAELRTIESIDEQDSLAPLADAQKALSILTCDLDEQAAVGGLHYPNTTCATAIASAEAMLSSWHYRNACNQQVGSDISSPATDASVTTCYVDNSGSAVVNVGLCCEPPATVSGIPDGTRKMCMEAGTPTQMLTECETDAQTNVDRYTSGIWTTQDYIAHWGDPCPVGTSIVPQSQFYVANSCNPLPNVGAGCSGPGSFNYEFQAGVLCQ